MQAVSIVIVSHGHEDDVKKLFDSLATFPESMIEVILIDNLNHGILFSEWIWSYSFKTQFVRNIKPYSFAKNNNIGVSMSSFENILLLNPDTWFEDSSLCDWLGKGEWNSNTLYYPRLFNPDGSNQIHGKKKPNLIDQLITLFFSLIGIKRSSREGSYWYFAAAVFFKRDLFVRIGGFDEMFPLYCEDVEFCDRARKMGVAIDVLQNVKVKHKLHDGSKNKYMKKAIISNIYYRVKSLYNTFTLNSRG